MEMFTVLQSFFYFLSTDTAALIFTSISHSLLLAGLIYSVVHLIKMMFGPVEKKDAYKAPVAEIEKLIS